MPVMTSRLIPLVSSFSLDFALIALAISLVSSFNRSIKPSHFILWNSQRAILQAHEALTIDTIHIKEGVQSPGDTIKGCDRPKVHILRPVTQAPST